MNTRTICISALALTLAAVTFFDGDARVRDNGARHEAMRKVAAKGRAENTNVSGRYTGLLSGTVEMNGRSVIITPETRFYVSGEGVVDDTPMLTGDPIYVITSQRDGQIYARTVFVNKGSNRYISSSDAITKMDPNTPR
jgi:hypothetical protein